MTCVLVVDDEPDIRMYARAVLERLGCDVLEAGHGQEALDLLGRPHEVDLVLLDIRMPVLSGWAVLETMEGWPAPRRPPVLVISAHTDADAAQRTIRQGAAGYLAKPFSIQQLRDWVTELIPAADA